jgi:hypothetical protein
MCVRAIQYDHPLQLRLGAKAPSLHILSRQGRGGFHARPSGFRGEAALNLLLTSFRKCSQLIHAVEKSTRAICRSIAFKHWHAALAQIESDTHAS